MLRHIEIRNHDSALSALTVQTVNNGFISTEWMWVDFQYTPPPSQPPTEVVGVRSCSQTTQETEAC